MVVTAATSLSFRAAVMLPVAAESVRVHVRLLLWVRAAALFSSLYWLAAELFHSRLHRMLG